MKRELDLNYLKDEPIVSCTIARDIFNGGFRSFSVETNVVTSNVIFEVSSHKGLKEFTSLERAVEHYNSI